MPSASRPCLAAAPRAIRLFHDPLSAVAGRRARVYGVRLVNPLEGRVMQLVALDASSAAALPLLRLVPVHLTR